MISKSMHYRSIWLIFAWYADTTVQIRCKVVSIGQTAGLIHGSIVSPDGKHLFNTMEHNKVNIKLRREEPKANL